MTLSNHALQYLREAYSTLKGIDPCQPSYQKLVKLLDSLSQDALKQLAGAKINFVSQLARNRVKEK